MQIIDQISWPLILIACATLGLAPFVPEPHIWEKLKMLFSGAPFRPLDIFDFLLHGAPFLVLLVKVIRTIAKAG
ncbi:MAG TPA: RND transporter [Octadecabacter sp.]|nr:RND transporter [Octadecabacter sp.]